MKDQMRRGISVTAEGEASRGAGPGGGDIRRDRAGQGPRTDQGGRDRRSSVVLATLRELGVAEADLHAPGRVHQPRVRLPQGPEADRLPRGAPDDGQGPRPEPAGRGARRGGIGRGERGPRRADERVGPVRRRAQRARWPRSPRRGPRPGSSPSRPGSRLAACLRIEEEQGAGVGPMPRMRAMAAMAEDVGAPTEVATGDLTVSRRIRAWFAIE